MVTQAGHNGIFSAESVHWLYDEVDVRGRDEFTHEILFSDGRIYRFRFHHLAMLTIESASEASAEPMHYAGR